MDEQSQGDTMRENDFEISNSRDNHSKVEFNLDALKDTIKSISSKADLTLFVKSSQMELLNFLDENPENKVANESLGFLETTYSEYLDCYIKVSIYSRLKLQNLYASSVIHIIEKISEIGASILLPAIYPLLQITGNEERPVSRFLYQKKVIPLLLRHVNSLDFSLQTLIEFLTEHNFNYLPFAKFITNQIKVEAKKADYVEEQIELLQDYHKFYSQLPVYQFLSDDNRLPSIKTHLLNWLDEEIKFCKRVVNKIPENQTKIDFRQATKIKSPFSVAQLGCLSRVLIETGVFANEVEIDVFRVLAASIESKNSKNISVTSLQNKSYEIEDATKESVRQILNEASKHLSLL